MQEKKKKKKNRSNPLFQKLYILKVKHIFSLKVSKFMDKLNNNEPSQTIQTILYIGM